MSSDRPISFFELSGESEVVLWWKILFWSVYGHMWGMGCPPQNEMWTPISPCIFLSQAGIQRSFLDVQSLTGLYTDIRSGRIVYSKTRYELRLSNLFFELSGESEVVLWWKILFRTVYRHTWGMNFCYKQDMNPDPPPYFFELSGDSEVVLGWKILFGTVYRHTWRMDFPPQNEIWTPISRKKEKTF